MDELFNSISAASTATLQYYRTAEAEQLENLKQGKKDPIWDWKIRWSDQFIQAIDAEIYRRRLYGY